MINDVQPGRRLKRPDAPRRLAIDDVDVLTQYGRADSTPPFRNRPRWQQQETELSMLYGLRPLAEATALVPHRPPRLGDLIRFTLAGRLRAAGFIVTSTPTRWNAVHVSVTLPGGAVPWDDEQAAAFESTFIDDVPGEGI